MKIAQFCDVFPPEIDGVGMVCKNYVTGLNELGHTTYYVAPHPKEPYPAHFPVINFKSIPVPKEPYTFGLPLLNPTFNRDIHKIKFDLIHSHTPFSAGIDAASKSFLKNVPLVTSFHSKYYDDFLLKTGSKLIANIVTDYVVKFYHYCDEVWTVNHATASVLVDYGYKGEIVVMPNGTNLWYPTAQDKLDAQNLYNLGDDTVFLFVGQHNFKKNIKHIIEALAIYKKTHDNFKMLFVGQGPDEAAMKKMVLNLGLEDHVIFAGHLSDRNLMMKIYARADLFIFPSLYDNAPMVVREAAAAGTPSIILRGSCSSEGIEDNVNGYLVDDSPVDIAKRMETALPSVSEVGSKARQTIPVSWPQVIKMVEERYENLIKRHKNH